MRKNIAILGDSRAFDTYYTNSHYRIRYGYEKTFPHVWRELALTDPGSGFEVIHIPDHFRGGTIQNNIVRLALTNPAVVVILDGIWETLLNRGHHNDYLERRASAGCAADCPEEPAYSSRRIVDLFKAGALSVSPAAYAEQQRRLVSYFRRRRRQIIWMTLPVPPKPYIGSTYHAGDYRPIADWDECLEAVNVAVVPMVEAYGGRILDLSALMDEFGGAERALIDQWHFSEGFHGRIAEALDVLVRDMLPDMPGPYHVSQDYMLDAPTGKKMSDDVVIYSGDLTNELDVLRDIAPDQILIYPSELGEIDNPRGNDRAEFEKQGAR